MAGIGFALRDLARNDAVGSSLRSYAYAAFVACGPWLFTVLSLGGIMLMGRKVMQSDDMATFFVIVTYNFSISLVISGPLVMVVTRLLADKIFLRNVSEVPGILLGALTLVLTVQAAVGVAYYGFVVDLSPVERVLAIICFLLVGSIWVASVFLSALKCFQIIGVAFGLGMSVALIGAASLSEVYGAAGALAGFTGGIALVLFILIPRILAEYPYPLSMPFGFLSAFRTYWQFALVGFLYNAGVWIDKWVMWLSPEARVFAGAMAAFPAYDGGMFLAYLSIVPAMAVFVVAIETRFFVSYRQYFDDIGNHTTFDQIESNHANIIHVLGQAFRNVVVLQGVICYVAILVAPRFISTIPGGLEMIPVFQIGTLSAFLHILFLFALIIISYFDLRGTLLSASAVFFVSNGAFSGASLLLGYEFYGYGYFLSVLLSLAVAYALAAKSIGRLPYMTFIGNNRGLR
jgi:uncharacterized membrane protein